MDKRLKQFSIIIGLLGASVSLYRAYTDVYGHTPLSVALEHLLQIVTFYLFLLIAFFIIVVVIIAILLLVANRHYAYPVFTRIADWLGVFTWNDLRILSEQPVLKLSYASLVIIPIIIYLMKFKIFGFQWVIPINLKLSYFSGLALL